MSRSEAKPNIPRDQLIAIRQARRYLRSSDGVLARLLSAHKAAEARGDQLGVLAEK